MKTLGIAFPNTLRRIRRDGFGPTVRSAFDALRSVTFHVYRLEKPPPTTVPFPEITIRRGQQTLRDARAARSLLPDEFYYDSKAGYQDCLIAWYQEQPAAILWLLHWPLRTPHPILSSSDAELAGLYVLHEYRGRGIARGLIAHACHIPLAERYSRLYAVIEQHNYSSQKTFSAMGFRRCGLWRRVTKWGPRWRPVSHFGTCLVYAHVSHEGAPATGCDPTQAAEAGRSHLRGTLELY
jgi:GNAT superfamily N-acetyltransferase